MAIDTRSARAELGEQVAAEHLTARGYAVVARNFRTRSGELDLVAANGSYLVFCEVKTRVAGGRLGPPSALDAIGPAKRRQVRRMAAQWLREREDDRRAHPPRVRFDAIGVTVNSAGGVLAVEHVEDAF